MISISDDNFEWSTVLDRLHTSIQYTLLQFALKIVLLFENGDNLLLILLLVTSTFYSIGFIAPEWCLSVNNVLSSLQTFSFLLFAQTTIQITTQNYLVTPESAGQRQLEFIVISTILLFIINTALYFMQESKVISRSLTLVLYMYVGAIENVTSAVGERISAIFIALAIYTVMELIQSYFSPMSSLNVLSRGIGMVAINVMLQNVSANTYDIYSKAGIFILLLFMINFLTTIVTHISEIKGYLLWKAASIIYQDYIHLFQDLQVGVFLAILISGVRYILPLKIWNDSIHTLFQLQMLVLVNMFLEPFTEILANRMSLENVVVAFNVILLVDMVMATVKANSR